MFSRRDALRRHVRKATCEESNARPRRGSSEDLVNSRTDSLVSHSDSVSPPPLPIADLDLSILTDCACCGILHPPRHALNDVYPRFPPHLLPPMPFIDQLLNYFHRYDASYHPIFHMPTFREDILNGRTSPALLCGILMIALRHVEPSGPDSNGWRWNWLLHAHLWDGLLEFGERLVAAEMALVHAGEFTVASRSRLEEQAKAVILNEYSNFTWGTNPNRNYTVDIFELTKLLDLGNDPLDTEIGEGKNLIERELRRRLVFVIIERDIAGSDILVTPIQMLPGLDITDYERGSQFLPSWLNTIVPCTDVTFDSLVRGTPSSVPLLPPLRFRDYHSYIHQPRGHPAREAFLRMAVGDILPRGFTAAVILQCAVWERVLRYRETCWLNGYVLYSPPSEDEKACAARETLLGVLDDIWEHLPERIVAMDAEGDGTGLAMLAAEHWGADRGPHL